MTELTRKQKEEVLRERIVSVALKAFLKEGIRAITMDDVASLMGISKRTLYELFPDKEQLVLSCVELHDIRKRAEAQPVYNKCDNVVDVLLSTDLWLKIYIPQVLCSLKICIVIHRFKS